MLGVQRQYKSLETAPRNFSAGSVLRMNANFGPSHKGNRVDFQPARRIPLIVGWLCAHFTSLQAMK
jgi:hypothetical protein